MARGIADGRLFMHPLSDDMSHDRALSARIAALNQVDLTLEHLDVHVDELPADKKAELDIVVRGCGESRCFDDERVLMYSTVTNGRVSYAR